jgi:hypothetical protein
MNVRQKITTAYASAKPLSRNLFSVATGKNPAKAKIDVRIERSYILSI